MRVPVARPMTPPTSPPRPIEISRLCPSNLPGTPRRRISPSFRLSLRISNDDRFDANIQAMTSNGIAISNVAKPIRREISSIRLSNTKIALSTKIVGHMDVRVVTERAARERIEALQQPEVMRHHQNDADVRDKRNGADLVHKVAV